MENLEWKWTDLEVGDKVKINNEYINYFENKIGFSQWTEYFKNKILKIKEIKINEYDIWIWFDCKNYFDDNDIKMYFNKDGKHNNIILFEIIELKEEKNEI
jgi:hypothetical protein